MSVGRCFFYTERRKERETRRVKERQKLREKDKEREKERKGEEKKRDRERGNDGEKGGAFIINKGYLVIRAYSNTYLRNVIYTFSQNIRVCRT